MSQQLHIFMEKLLREVTEGQSVPRRVRLICEGTTFETWEPIQGAGIEPDSWARDAEAIVQSLLSELPKRRVQLSFIAEDSQGATLQTLLRTVTGQNANAQDLGTQNGAKALADAIASVAKTMDATLETARKIMEFQAQRLETAHEQLADAHEMFMAIRKVELEGDQQDNATSRIMVEQLQQAAPALLTSLRHGATSPSKSSGGAVASVVNAATNGVKAS